MCSNKVIADLASGPSDPASLIGSANGNGDAQERKRAAESAARGVEGAQLVLQHRKLSALLNCHVTSLLSFGQRGRDGVLAGRGGDADLAEADHGSDQGGKGGDGRAEKEGICRVHPVQVQTGCATGRIGTR